MCSDDSISAIDEVSDDLVLLGVSLEVDNEIVVHEGEVLEVFSAKLEVILELGIDLVDALVFPLQSRYLLPAFLDLVDSNPKDVLGLRNVLGQIIVFHNLVLGSSLIMYGLAFMFIRQCSNRRDIPLQRYDVIIGVVDLVI